MRNVFEILTQVSMIDVDTFGAIREVLKARKSELAVKKELSEGSDDLGNLHMLLFGDFKQLPPATSKVLYCNVAVCCLVVCLAGGVACVSMLWFA